MSERADETKKSWLSLERLALGELPPAEADALRRALDRDPESAAAWRLLEGDTRALPPLPAPRATGSAPLTERVRQALGGYRWILAGALATAALVLALTLGRTGSDVDRLADRLGTARVPAARIHIKGGDLAISLVRERAGDIVHDPVEYRDGDRFKVLVTCPPGAQLFGAVVVYQEDGASLPFSGPDGASAAPLACGNRIAVPGAFRLTGAGPARVCLVIDRGRAPERALLTDPARALAAPERAVCAALERAASPR